MLVGIVSGTYSTIFIAGAIATMISRRSPAEAVAPARRRARGQAVNP
jgi:preprotein translocase subunit SecF